MSSLNSSMNASPAAREPGQLDAELEQGAWFVVASEPGDPFSGTPERLWRDVLRRQRGRLALFSNYPEDATVN